MSIIQSIKQYKKLNSWQKTFIKNGGVEDAMSIPKWIKALEPICRYDQVQDDGSAKFSVFTLVVVLVAIVVCFLAFAFEAYLLILLIIAVAVLLVTVNVKAKRFDVNNNVRDIIYPMLHVLALEVGHKKKVSMKINFHKRLKKDEIDSVDDKSSLMRRNKSVFYSYDVLELSCALMDGTTLTWHVNDTVRQRTRNNGKKTKTKKKLNVVSIPCWCLINRAINYVRH